MTALRNGLPVEELAKQAESGEPEKANWSQAEQLLAAVLDATRRVEWVLLCANIEAKAKRPDPPLPTRRPGAGPRPKRRAQLTEASAGTLFQLINGGAA